MRQLSTILIGLTMTLIYGCTGRNAVVPNSKEYQPEEMMTTSRYQQIVREIELSSLGAIEKKEEVSFEHIDCGSGACPIDFK